MKFPKIQICGPYILPLLLVTLVTPLRAANITSPEACQEQESKLIAIIKSDAPPQEKAVPCKLLAVYGTKNAVPALAALLSNRDLASWARIALEAIPDPSVDDALRSAMKTLQGNLLIGVINSIGVRQDAKAVSGLVTKLKDPDPKVASAAAIALGHIGGSKAAAALIKSLPNAPAEARSAVAEGGILCAEKMLAQGQRKDAVNTYAAVRKGNVPKERMLEATRGEILARGPEGLDMLLEQLRASDKGLLAIGLHTARELPGRKVTEALGNEMHRASADRQAFLLLAISDRKDDAALPLVLDAAKNGSAGLRLVAVGILDRQGNVSSIPVLLDAAASSDAALSQAALTALARLPGNKVDSDVLARLPGSSGKVRQVLIDLAAQRRIEGAIPVIVQSSEDKDAEVRNVSIQALGVLASNKQIPDLVRIVAKTSDAKERSNIEMALIGICERNGSACAEPLLPLARNTDPALRVIALHALASAGGASSLVAVKTAVEDQDESVRDEAVRTLSTWPNNWPEDAAVAEPLLALAKSGKSMTQQVLGMRGYLQYVKGDKGLKDEDKVTRVNELLPLLKRPEEKRLAIAAIDGIPTSAGLDLLMSFAAEPAIADDACSAILTVTGKSIAAVPKEQRQKALQTVVANSSNGDTKKRAEELLKKSL